MKKSELKDYIKEQISDILSMDEMEKIKPEDVENLEKYNDALKVKKSLEKMEEDEDDAPAGDKDVDTKARGNDKIIKDFRRIQKQMQTHLQMFKDAEGADAKKAAKQMLLKLTPEFQAAKKKYDKIANI